MNIPIASIVLVTIGIVTLSGSTPFLKLTIEIKYTSKLIKNVNMKPEVSVTTIKVVNGGTLRLSIDDIR